MSPSDENRLHIALNVSNLAKSVRFYQELFETAPDKEHRGYARFNLSDPAVVLTLNEGKKVRSGNRIGHMGIRVSSAEILERAYERLRDQGHWIKQQLNVTCCNARQNKFWVQDPDGIHWEFYEFLGDVEEKSARSDAAQVAES